MFIDKETAAMPGLYGHMIVDPEIANDKSENVRLAGLELLLDDEPITPLGLISYDDFFEDSDVHAIDYESAEEIGYFSLDEDEGDEQHPLIAPGIDDDDFDDETPLENSEVDEPEPEPEAEEDELSIAS